MELCMFHPVDHAMERGWVGRIEDDHVVHLAAQTLQAFFTGGGSAREHAVYPRAGVRLLAPVLHPPSIRMFDSQTSFEFGNPAAILGPDTEVVNGVGDDWFTVEVGPRIAGIVGSGEEIAGFTIFADWRARGLEPPKDRDFAFGLGPLVVTPEELPQAPEAVVRIFQEETTRGRFDGFDWLRARDLAAERTLLLPGDVLAGPPLAGPVVEPATVAEIEVEGIGTLRQTVLPEVELE
jgi:Fumarylacetoacetate (FAA) hydrolase family